MLRDKSPFSGYGGPAPAAARFFNARTGWLPEVSGPVARVAARHRPDAPNLNDSRTIAWT